MFPSFLVFLVSRNFVESEWLWSHGMVLSIVRELFPHRAAESWICSEPGPQALAPRANGGLQ